MQKANRLLLLKKVLRALLFINMGLKESIEPFKVTCCKRCKKPFSQPVYDFEGNKEWIHVGCVSEKDLYGIDNRNE